MIVVSNTGPLIAFLKSGEISILEKLYSTIFIPPKVRDEILAYRDSTEVNIFRQLSWIKIQELKTQPEILLQNELDEGEAEVIQLALEMKPDLVIIDEKKARRICQLIYRLPLKGTAGILVAAKRQGIIDHVMPIMENIKKNGYYLSDRLVETVLKQAGEN